MSAAPFPSMSLVWNSGAHFSSAFSFVMGFLGTVNQKLSSSLTVRHLFGRSEVVVAIIDWLLSLGTGCHTWLSQQLAGAPSCLSMAGLRTLLCHLQHCSIAHKWVRCTFSLACCVTSLITWQSNRCLMAMALEVQCSLVPGSPQNSAEAAPQGVLPATCEGAPKRTAE
jgi:hypothetical protein